MGTMFTNVVERADDGEACRDALAFQLDQAHRLGMTTTILVSNRGMHDPATVDLVRHHMEEHGEEVGIHLHCLRNADYEERFGTREPAIYLLPRDKKAAVLDYLFEQFQRTFGFAPRVLGSYILDTWTLNHIDEQFPTVETAITNCFEEGVNMAHGNNQNWVLFSDGGPWGPFIPSRQGSLCPARDADDALDLVALPHLNRDMILSLCSRDDWFASHPLNLVRAGIVTEDDSPYMHRFIEEWARQAEVMGWSYYNMFVSTPWLNRQFALGLTQEEGRRLYVRSLEHLQRLEQEGRGRTVTMGEFGRWFRQNVPPGEPQVCLWREQLLESKRTMFWASNSSYRMSVDLNIGGTVCDLRPYAGRFDTNLGPETEQLWNGNYPFLMASEHRGGFWNNGLTCAVGHGEAEADLTGRRVTGTARRLEDGSYELTVDPLTLEVGDLEVTLQSVWTFDGTGDVGIERHILDCSDPDAELTVTERLRAEWGTTEYAERMDGIVLRVVDAQDGAKPLEYGYADEVVASDRARRVEADVPQVNTRIALVAAETPARGRAADGHLFSQPFTLELTGTVRPGESRKTWLRISAIPK